jgi:hypothetical protein
MYHRVLYKVVQHIVLRHYHVHEQFASWSVKQYVIHMIKAFTLHEKDGRLSLYLITY